VTGDNSGFGSDDLPTTRGVTESSRLGQTLVNARNQVITGNNTCVRDV